MISGPRRSTLTLSQGLRLDGIPRLLLLAGILLTVRPSSLISASGPLDQTGPMVRYDSLRSPEVRLRKLHLVRPDLIPYPIDYEVVC